MPEFLDQASNESCLFVITRCSLLILFETSVVAAPWDLEPFETFEELGLLVRALNGARQFHRLAVDDPHGFIARELQLTCLTLFCMIFTYQLNELHLSMCSYIRNSCWCWIVSASYRGSYFSGFVFPCWCRAGAGAGVPPIGSSCSAVRFKRSRFDAISVCIRAMFVFC